MILTKTKLSKICKVTQSAISVACREQRLIQEADGKINILKEPNKTYIQNHTFFNKNKRNELRHKNIKKQNKKDNRKSIKNNNNGIDIDNIEIPDVLNGYTIKQLESESDFEKMPLQIWKIRQSILQAKERTEKLKIENKFKRGELVSQKLTSGLLFNYLSQLTDQLFDFSDTYSLSIVSKIKSSPKPEQELVVEIRKEMLDNFSRLVVETKKRIEIKLKELKKIGIENN